MLFYSLMKANHLVFLNLEIYKERCCDICIYRYFYHFSISTFSCVHAVVSSVILIALTTA